MNYKHILAIDPSGSYEEGNGVSGWCLMDCSKNNKLVATGFIEAHQFDCAQAYWHEHLELIELFRKEYGKDLILIIEEYVLYADKSKSQINSKMETCRVIGIMQHHAWQTGIPFGMQLASEVVNRWNNTVLEHKEVIVPFKKGFSIPHSGYQLNRHVLDSIRHATHYATFKNRKEGKNL